jgi:hypothetical protein
VIDDTVVLFSRWLNGDIDPAASVNALLPSVARRGADPEPPQLKAVYNEVESLWIIKGTEPDVVPAIAVSATNAEASLYSLGGQRGESADSLQRAQSGIAGSPLIIGVTYMLRGEDLVKGIAQSGYTLAAIRKSIGLLEQASQASRTLNTTLFLGTRQITERRLLVSIGNSSVMGIVLTVCLVRDLAP